MVSSRSRFSPEIQKAFSLSSRLSIDEQIRFLKILVSIKSKAGKEELIDRALVGERVWECKKAG